ncbi:SDR family oxidoreductase [Streptomyces adustus]|uniref:SDR family oxidoreductase n=1 Tax=Streptomyces adustus TaxID=1609272 RepID=A0A5N8VEG7_9ACTN|nr:SDR family oxidoreductase [Streptomyces adustus]MPY33246.1 SDR family oxidoreductase [Streptomyces adustus]
MAHVIDLDGKIAVVTGASSGLGRQFALTLADAGATVVAAARRTELLAELAAGHERIVPHRCDVTDETDRAGLVARAEDLGGVDILVNNAGWADALPAFEQPVDSFSKTLDIDVTALFRLSVLAARSMAERDGGAIVNIASILGMVASAPVTQSAYGAAKGAVISLTRHLAAEWARHGVRVNAIAPGFFPSELTAEMLADESASRWIARNTPMGRPGRPGELDGALLLLAGPGGTYITGQTIAVDGGWTAR